VFILIKNFYKFI